MQELKLRRPRVRRCRAALRHRARGVEGLHRFLDISQTKRTFFLLTDFQQRCKTKPSERTASFHPVCGIHHLDSGSVASRPKHSSSACERPPARNSPSISRRSARVSGPEGIAKGNRRPDIHDPLFDNASMSDEPNVSPRRRRMPGIIASRSTGPTISMIVSKDIAWMGVEHAFSPWLVRPPAA